MKKINVLFFILIICFCPIRQKAQVIEQEEGDTYAINTVKFLIKEKSLGVASSFGSKSKYRLGDKVSIALMKILTDSDYKDTQKIMITLSLIQSCFDHPELIEIPEDKKPKVTLIFLAYLENSAADSTLKQNIRETISVIKVKTAPVKK